VSALEEIEKSSIVAIIRTKTSAEGRSAAAALKSAGITLFEFTTTTPDVFDLIEEYSAIKGITVGVGTAMSPAHVTSAKKFSHHIPMPRSLRRPLISIYFQFQEFQLPQM
jgi:2-keto-3-deoxy-6-phosphogluconate aldolase